MRVDFSYIPLEVHAPFHQSTAYERALFGAFGSGKTYALCAECIAVALEQPGSRLLVTRKTIPELRDTTETVFFDILPQELYQACEIKRLGGHVAECVFPNGSTVLFRGIDDWMKHKSLNVAFIFWDEADEFDEETYLGMSSRVRQRDPTAAGKRYGATEITRRGMCVASNPAGKNWLYRRFVDPKTRKPNTAYFKSTSFDNPFLPVEYLESLLQYPEPWVRRYVLCQFDDFAGQIYEDWDWDTHVIEPFKEFPRGAVFWMGFDPGTRSDNAALWVYVDEAKRELIGVAEYEAAGLAANIHAAEWRKIEAQLMRKARGSGRVTYRVADPSSITVRDRGSNMGLDAQYARLGFHFQLGPKRPQDRIPMLGQLISNFRFKVTKDCPRTYEAIKNYQWVDLTPAQRARGEDPPDKPLKKDTHLVECAQYVSSRMVPAMKDARPIPVDLSEREYFSREVVQNIRKQQRSQRFSRSPQPGVII